MSKFHAIDSLDDAFERTKDLLFRPFKLSLWIKIAIVVLIAESLAIGSSNLSYREDLKELNFDITQYIGIIIAVVILLIFIGLVIQFLSSVFNFVFVESVLEKKVEIVNGFKRNIRRGFRLFLFNIGILIALVVTIALGIFVVLLIDFGSISAISLLIIMTSGFLAFFGIILIFLLINVLTMDFVLVLMYLKNKGIIKSWIYLKDFIRSNFSQFIVYILVKFFLGIVATVVILIVSLVIYLPVMAMAILLGLTSLNLLDILSMLSLPIIILTLIGIFTLTFLLQYLITLTTLPIHVFFRYYSIIFLNRLDPSLGVLKTRDKDIKEEIGSNLSIY